MELPRVTEVLKYYTSYEQVPRDILHNAAARGTTVHSLCSGIAKGNWIPDGMIGQEYLGYVNSFKKWTEDQVKKFIIIEKRYNHETLGYTGQLDFVILGHDDELYLVDLKTSARPQKTYPVQMAAYEHLLKEKQVLVKGAMLVYLDKDGDYPKIHVLDDMTEQLGVFLCALECYKYFNKRKANDNRKPGSDTSGTSESASAESGT